MKEQELIGWFNNYFDNCYNVKNDAYPESIFMYYDINYVRQLKIAKLEGKEIPIKIDITGVCIFEQNWNNFTFNCDYGIIWYFLQKNYIDVYYHIRSFIENILIDNSELNGLLPRYCFFDYLYKNKELNLKNE